MWREMAERNAHILGYRLSRHRFETGRRRVSRELRGLIFRMVAENPTWGAPRIHGELLALGFDISERTVSRWGQRAPRDPEQRNRWKAFLRNHCEVIDAMDFFTVHTAAFGILYCFFVIAHDGRRILHFNVTRNPTSLWVVQQLRETFSEARLNLPGVGFFIEPSWFIRRSPSPLSGRRVGVVSWRGAPRPLDCAQPLFLETITEQDAQ